MLLSYKKDISSISISFEVQEKRLNNDKAIIKFLLKVLPIQTTNWDNFSINKYNFNHKPIANPETFGLKSYAKSLKEVLKLAKLPRCNIN